MSKIGSPGVGTNGQFGHAELMDFGMVVVRPSEPGAVRRRGDVKPSDLPGNYPPKKQKMRQKSPET